MEGRKVSLRLPAGDKQVLKVKDFAQLTKASSLPSSPEPFFSVHRPKTVRKGLTFAFRNRPKAAPETPIPLLEFKVLHRRKGKTSSLDWLPTLSPCTTPKAFLTAGQRLTLHTKRITLVKPATPGLRH